MEPTEETRSPERASLGLAARTSLLLVAIPVLATIATLVLASPTHEFLLPDSAWGSWSRSWLGTWLITFLVLEILTLLYLRRKRPVRAPSTQVRSGGLRLQAVPSLAACPFCKGDIARADLGDGIVRCPSCNVAQHAVCWRDHGGCVTFGCDRAPGERGSASSIARRLGNR